MTISVTQLNNYIKGILDTDAVLANLSVCGEITNVKQYKDGWYFSLKDENGAVNCFCYTSAVQPIAGLMAIAEGKLNYFTKTGSISFFVKRLTVSDESGAQYLRYAQLKEKLSKEGLFDEQRKKPVPAVCNKIGIVTSPTGAVITDITNVCLRRSPFCNLFLYPVKVQGVGADQEIVQGIEYFENTDVDVIIVGRGGGSNEDLSVFNSEIIVRAIACCKKPVVSAVGHGIDFTLCDFVADKRAVTPSEAAEFVTIDARKCADIVCNNLLVCGNSLSKCVKSYQDKIALLIEQLSNNVATSLQQTKSNVVGKVAYVNGLVTERVNDCVLSAEKLVSKVSALNPTHILSRGYAYLTKQGQTVTTAKQVAVGDDINVTLCDGKFVARVTSKEKK